jgi:glycosyltransferase involved in cell wall biosynthesis
VAKLKTLFIFLRWPEPTSSAAGWRMLQIMSALRDMSSEIIAASAADKTEYSQALGIVDREQMVVINDQSFDQFIQELQPDLVVFDRFITEEQFGWRVAKHVPKAIRVLDTEDIHFLRHAREQALITSSMDLDFHNEECYRELASILRCDLSLMISEAETMLLKNKFGAPDSRLHYLPFLHHESEFVYRSFEERDGFVFIGNFLHKPNADAVKVLKEMLWPLIRKKIPKAQLRIYGAYMDEHWQQLNDPSSGFYMMGRAEDATSILSNAKVLLAPIRFGAGLKGKIFQALQCGTPVVSTAIGLEGFFDERVAIMPDNNWDDLAAQAELLHQDQALWQAKMQQGKNLLVQRFSSSVFSSTFIERIDALTNSLEMQRKSDFQSAMLNYHSFRAAQFMARWIEEKNSKSD